MREPVITPAFLAHIVGAKVLGYEPLSLREWFKWKFPSFSAENRNPIMVYVISDLEDMGFRLECLPGGKETWLLDGKLNITRL